MENGVLTDAQNLDNALREARLALNIEVLPKHLNWPLKGVGINPSTVANLEK